MQIANYSSFFRVQANNLLAQGDLSLKQMKDVISQLRKGTSENLISSLSKIDVIINKDPGILFLSILALYSKFEIMISVKTTIYVKDDFFFQNIET